VAFLLAMTLSVWSGDARAASQQASTVLLLAAWPLGVAATLVTRRIARSILAVDARVPMTGDAAADLAVLEARDPLRDTCTTALRWERSSAALPMAAISLLAPLTLHWLVWLVISWPHLDGDVMQSFGTWIGMSGILVGHAHIALLVVAVRWTGKLRATPTRSLRVGVGRAWGVAMFWAVGIAAVPGLALLAVPPVLTAVTGIVFVPLMFIVTARCIQRERVALEET
jgi:hypothetical protein